MGGRGRGRGVTSSSGAVTEEAAGQRWTLCEWLFTPAGVVMGKPNSAALPDHAILENVGKFMCTHLYLNVDKKLKQF